MEFWISTGTNNFQFLLNMPKRQRTRNWNMHARSFARLTTASEASSCTPISNSAKFSTRLLSSNGETSSALVPTKTSFKNASILRSEMLWNTIHLWHASRRASRRGIISMEKRSWAPWGRTLRGWNSWGWVRNCWSQRRSWLRGS